MSKEEFEDYTSGEKVPKRVRTHVSATKSIENLLRKTEELNEANAILEQRIDELNESVER
jgi:hypothetical protein